MPLADCVIATSAEVSDPTLVVAGVTYAGGSIAENGSIRASIQGAWTPPTNPYIIGVQFQYGPTDLTGPPTNTPT